jgi:hypothetical protein
MFALRICEITKELEPSQLYRASPQEAEAMAQYIIIMAIREGSWIFRITAKTALRAPLSVPLLGFPEADRARIHKAYNIGTSIQSG